MKRDTAIGVAIVVGLVAVLAVGWRLIPEDSVPEASGRTGDACRATGPVGLVGVDADSGAERWTNVVGRDVANVWTPGPDGDVRSGDSDQVFVIGGTARIRQVDAADGSVEACSSIDELSPDEVGRPIPVDATGAFARDRTTSAVEVVEADGTSRWVRDGRTLVAASTGGVVTQTNLEPGAGPPRLALEVLDPATGELRWRREVPGLSGVATPTHLLVTDQFGGTGGQLVGSPSQVARVTAYDLADGAEAWHVDAAGTPETVYADADVVMVPGYEGGPVLTVVDEATGDVRWRKALSAPGRGGDETEPAVVVGAAVAGDVIAVAVESRAPHRD